MFSQLSDFIQKIRHLDRKIQMYLLICVLGLAWIVIGLWLLLWSGQNEVVVNDVLSDQGDLPENSVTVDISGAVVKPGIYQLSPGARVGEVVSMAGGFHDQADHSKIAQTLNLAEKITDGQKIFIPTFTPTIIETGNGVESLTKSAGSPTSLQISFNTASMSELESLPGIGEKKAADIVAGRPYSSMADVQSVIKVTETQWEAIQKIASL